MIKPLSVCIQSVYTPKDMSNSRRMTIEWMNKSSTYRTTPTIGRSRSIYMQVSVRRREHIQTFCRTKSSEYENPNPQQISSFLKLN
jgi:hypothetical protein